MKPEWRRDGQKKCLLAAASRVAVGVASACRAAKAGCWEGLLFWLGCMADAEFSPVLQRAIRMRRKIFILGCVVTTVLLALRLVHLRADFTAMHWLSQEGAEFTDEGFYTSAALHRFTGVPVYISGGWNPGVFMPVWPLLVGAVFHYTGVSIFAARALAVLCTWITALLAYRIARQYRSQMFAVCTALLFAANALGFFIGRLAILEPSFAMFLLLAVWMAGKVRAGGYAQAAAVGAVFVVLTLTKTTGPFVLPAILYPMWANHRTERRAAGKLVAVALGVVVLLLGCAKILWARQYAVDTQIILAMNPLWQLEHALPRLVRFFFRGTWIDPVLFPLALLCAIASAGRLRYLWRDTLFVTSFLWEAGYAAFIVFHYDGPPRYFVPLIVPTIWLALIFLEALWPRQKQWASALAACVVISALWNLASIAQYLAHPRYSFLDACAAIRRTVEADSSVPPLLIGRGAEEVSLLGGGMPAIDSDGAMPLAQKISTYHAGWLVQWTRYSPQQQPFKLVAQGEYSVFSPDKKAVLRLYKILPTR
jgi:hypothetical protein